APVDSVLTRKIQVPIVTLDNLKQDLALRIGLLKLDIEGGEFAAFQGAKDLLMRDQPYLLFEEDDRFCRSFGHCAADVRDFLSQLGYQLFAVESQVNDGYRLTASDKAPVLSEGQRNLFGLSPRRVMPSW